MYFTCCDKFIIVVSDGSQFKDPEEYVDKVCADRNGEGEPHDEENVLEYYVWSKDTHSIFFLQTRGSPSITDTIV